MDNSVIIFPKLRDFFFQFGFTEQIFCILLSYLRDLGQSTLILWKETDSPKYTLFSLIRLGIIVFNLMMIGAYFVTVYQNLSLYFLLKVVMFQMSVQDTERGSPKRSRKRQADFDPSLEIDSKLSRNSLENSSNIEPCHSTTKESVSTELHVWQVGFSSPTRKTTSTHFQKEQQSAFSIFSDFRRVSAVASQ